MQVCAPKKLEMNQVPLTFAGKSGVSQEFDTLLEVCDGDKRVVVIGSQEAIDDHGLSAV